MPPRNPNAAQVPALSDPRLRLAASLVRPGAVVADIGTDHGFLVCHLVGSGHCPRGFACDINPAPLQRARRTVENQDLSTRIELLLTDGMNGLQGKDVDDFVIMGMGGELIAKILGSQPWAQNPHFHFVLQPMTRAEHLRRFLYQSGFAIQKEVAVMAGRFVYSIFSVTHTGFVREIEDLFAWTGLLWYNRDEESLVYLARVAAQLRAVADGLRRTHGRAGDADHYHALAEEIYTHLHL